MATRRSKNADHQPMFFSAYNYKIIGIAIFLIFIGFTSMYLENEVSGFVSLFISPILVMVGYVLVIFAIMKHDRDDESNKAASS